MIVFLRIVLLIFLTYKLIPIIFINIEKIDFKKNEYLNQDVMFWKFWLTILLIIIILSISWAIKNSNNFNLFDDDKIYDESKYRLILSVEE